MAVSGFFRMLKNMQMLKTVTGC